MDSDIPDHSVISKARRRWGVEVFAEFFGRVLEQCVQAGLVEGKLVHVDSSIQAAHADRSQLRTALLLAGRELYDALDRQDPAPAQANPSSPPELGKPVSPTDPDARLTHKHGKTYLGYKDHRVVDDQVGIITASTTTAANVNDGTMLMGLLERHAENTGQSAQAVAADSAYGTGQNYQDLREQGVRAAIPHQRQKGLPGKFGRDQFVYDAAQDCYVWPAGQKLRRIATTSSTAPAERSAGPARCVPNAPAPTGGRSSGTCCRKRLTGRTRTCRRGPGGG